MNDSHCSFEDAFARYVDRLNAGEGLDKERIRADNPNIADRLLEELEAYELFGGELEVETPLGTLGDYTLRRQVGRGGMGVVYEAWENSMDRRVALKVLPAGVAVDARACARFLREAQTAGKLNHPNVVPVFFTGIKEQTPFYAMEFVEGETLAQVLAKLRERSNSPTPFGRSRDDQEFYLGLARAFADVADGLQHAHSKGIIHRDIKPSNLILDTDGRLRILDFGLARLEGQESLTISGDVVGTPLYMSPEQAKRKKILVDHRTDVYSLGATLYEMLTLQPPFRGKDHNDTLSQIIERDAVEPRKANQRVPKDLETIVLKCLRKDAGDRYWTAEAMGQDLRRFVRGDAIEARSQPAWERFTRRLARQRLLIAGGAMVVVALAILCWQAIVWHDMSRQRIERAYDQKVLSSALRLELASLAQKARSGEQPFWGMEASSGKLSRPDKLDPVQDAFRSLEECRAMLPQRTDARYHLARALILLGKQEEAEKRLEGLISGRSPFVPAMTLEAEILESRGAREQAESLLKEAERHATEGWEKVWVEIWRGWRTKRFAELLEKYSRLLDLTTSGREPFIGCSLLARLGRGQTALKAKDIIQALEDFNTAQSLAPGAALPALLAGKAWLAIEKKDQSEQVFQRLFERTDQKDEVAAAVWGIYVWDPGSQKEALAWAGRITIPSARESRRARVLCHLGRYSEAEETGRKALEHDPKDHDASEILAYVLMVRAKPVEAREVLERGLEHHPHSCTLNLYLGRSYMTDPRNINKAILYLDRALELPDRVMHPYVWDELGQCYFWKGDWRRALEMNRKALETGNTDQDDSAGLMLINAGMLPEAVEAFDRAIASEPLESSFRANKGRALYLEKRLDEALVCLREAQSLLPRFLQPFRDAGRVLELQGRASDALSEYLRAVTIDPEEKETHGLLDHLLRSARPFLEADALGEAVEVLEAALKTTGLSQPASPRISTSLGLALAARRGTHDCERALEVLLPLLEAGGTAVVIDPRLLDVLGNVFQAFASDAPGRAPLALLASLPPYQAIDAALSVPSDPQADLDGLLVSFRPSGDEPEARKRYLYLEGSILARKRNYPRSIEKLEELATLDASSIEPVLRLAEVLRLAGQPERAEGVLRDTLDDMRSKDRRLWDHWLAVELVDFKRLPADVIERVPAASGTAASESDYRGDVLWLLDRLNADDAIRINCGGGEYQEPEGKLWGKDRFALGGGSAADWDGNIEGTKAAALYQTERSFPLEDSGMRSAYVIPLPPGEFRVHLHFAEVTMNIKGVRRFDVLLQGKKVIEDFDPMEAGFATAVEKVFDASVDGGLLEVRFVHRSPYDVPQVSAIEVERTE